MEDSFPRISKQLNKKGIVPFAYATGWFHTLFTYNCPLAIAARFWDVIWSVVVLHDKFFEYENNGIIIQDLVEGFLFNYIELNEKLFHKTDVYDIVEKLQKIEVRELDVSIIIQKLIQSLPLRDNQLKITDILNSSNISQIFGSDDHVKEKCHAEIAVHDQDQDQTQLNAEHMRSSDLLSYDEKKQDVDISTITDEKATINHCENNPTGQTQSSVANRSSDHDKSKLQQSLENVENEELNTLLSLRDSKVSQSLSKISTSDASVIQRNDLGLSLEQPTIQSMDINEISEPPTNSSWWTYVGCCLNCRTNTSNDQK